MIKYRTEMSIDSEHRALPVMLFEITELHNADILEYVSENYLLPEELKMDVQEIIDNIDDVDEYGCERILEEVLNCIENSTGKKIRYALWLADKDAVEDIYEGDERDIYAYNVDDAVVLSDLEYDGTLYGFEEMPEPIEDIVESKKEELYNNIMEKVVRIVNKCLNESAEDSKFNMDALNKSENNLKIVQRFPDVYKCNQSPDKSLIGTTIQISDSDTTDKADVTIYGKTFVEMCKKIAIIYKASMIISWNNIFKHSFDVSMNNTFEEVWKKVIYNLSNHDKEFLDSVGEKLYYDVFVKSNSVQDVLAKLRTFKMK